MREKSPLHPQTHREYENRKFDRGEEEEKKGCIIDGNDFLVGGSEKRSGLVTMQPLYHRTLEQLASSIPSADYLALCMLT